MKIKYDEAMELIDKYINKKSDERYGGCNQSFVPFYKIGMLESMLAELISNCVTTKDTINLLTRKD